MEIDRTCFCFFVLKKWKSIELNENSMIFKQNQRTSMIFDEESMIFNGKSIKINGTTTTANRHRLPGGAGPGNGIKTGVY